MPRVDIWDVPESHAIEPIDCGYKRGLTDNYDFDRPLGEGGFGSVRLVRQKSNGAEFACKSICKRLDVPNLPPIKQQQHLQNIKREVLILRKLRGTLNVVHLEAVYEDDTHVHIIMEYCKGGELFHRMGKRHYSERTVASYMRAVLRTLAQCHTHRILHRDIKPGNFMLLTEAEDAPLKAIDFGLAVFFNPHQLPLTDLGLEGTPWYMAPEVLSAAVEPASDVWAAGVMAYQLLSGRFPFDDWQNPKAPALSLVWRSIISEEPSFSRSGWQDITQEAKDFCKALLNKDPKSRPSARDALRHPWLQQGNARQRTQGAQLTQVVQRLQRFNQQNVFKKTVLDMIANELLTRHMGRIREAEEQAAAEETAAAAAAARDGAEGTQQQQQQQQLGSPSSLSGDIQAARSVSGPEFLRSLSSGPQAAIASPADSSPAAAAAAQVPHYLEGSVHRQQQLLRLIPPKRSLDLSPSETQALKSQRPKTLAAAATSPGVNQPESQAGQFSGSKLLLAAAAARLDRSWHGPPAGRLEGSFRGSKVLGTSVGSLGESILAQGLEGSLHGQLAVNPQGSLHGSGAWGLDREGSIHRRIGSVKGATSALEALRRARERKSYAEGLAAVTGSSSDAQQLRTESGEAGVQQQAPGSSPAAAAAAKRASPVPIPGAAQQNSAWHVAAATAAAAGGGEDVSYKGPVRDASSASLWDLQFMANRLAMEGSAHGNAYAHKLLQAASTHAGRTPSSVAMLQAAAAVAAQQQGQAGDTQQQQRVTAGPVADITGRPSSESLDPQLRIEGTWHGPGAATAAEQLLQRIQSLDRSYSGGDPSSAANQLMQRVSALDRSWHGRTDFTKKLAGAAAGVSAASKRAAEERAEFLRFLEAAKRQRQEQRKVVRLVLEGSVHGAPSSVAGHHRTGADWKDTGSVDSYDSSVEEAAIQGGGSTAGGTNSTRGSTSGGGFRDGTAALTAAERGDSSQKKGRSFLSKLKSSVKSLLAGDRDAPNSRAISDGTTSSTTSEAGLKRVDSLNKLARESWLPPEADADKVTGTNTAGKAADGTIPSETAAAAAAAAAGGGGGGSIAEQILELQSPGWQASLESRRRGQGAYAALMAATSIVQADETEPTVTPPAAAAAAAAATAKEVPASSAAPATVVAQTAAPSSKPPAAASAAAPTASTAGVAPATSKVKPYWAEGSSVLLPPGKPQQQHQQQPVTAAVPGGIQEQQQPSQPAAASPTADHQQPSQLQQQQQQQSLAAAGSLLPIPLGQRSLLPVPGGAASAATAANSTPLPQQQQQQQQQQYYMQQPQHNFLLVPKPPQLPQVPEEPEQQQQPQPRDMLPRPGGSSALKLVHQSQLLPTPAAAKPWLAKPQVQGGLTPTPGKQTPFTSAKQLGAGLLPTAFGLDSRTPLPPPASADVQNTAATTTADTAKAAAAAAAGTANQSAAAVPPPPSSLVASPLESSAAVSADDVDAVGALQDIQELLDLLQYNQHEVITVEQLQHGLARLGFVLEPSEVLEIAKDLGYGVEGVDGVAMSQFAASQLDWEHLQVNHRDEWLECVRSAFDALDVDKDGRIKPADVMEVLKAKLPEAEVNAAIEDVLLEAAADEDEGLDFAAFQLLASLPTTDNLLPLDHYDARLGAAASPAAAVKQES